MWVAARKPRFAPFLHGFTLPWTFLGPEEYLSFLPRCGFKPRRVELVGKDMVHDSPDELRAWMRTTWMPILTRLPEPLRPSLVDAAIATHCGPAPPTPSAIPTSPWSGWRSRRRPPSSSAISNTALGGDYCFLRLSSKTATLSAILR